MSKANTPVRRVIKVVSWAISILVLLFVVIVLAIRTPQVQTRLTGLASDWLESKTGAQLSIDQLYLTFRGDLQIDELLLTAPAGDTLLYSRFLEVGASLPAIVDGDISLTRINWQGVVAKIKADEAGRFNFQFIIDAFNTGDKPTPAPPTKPLALEIGPIDLRDIDFRYTDEKNKIDLKTSVRQLILEPAKVDLERLLFHVTTGSIDGTIVEVTQFGKSNAVSATTSSTSLLPEIIVDALTIKEVDVIYASLSDSLRLSTQVGALGIKKAHLNLNVSKIAADALTINGSQVAFTSSASGQQTIPDTSAVMAFVWPEWDIDLQKLSINSTSLALALGPAAERALFIDPNQMDWDLKSIEASGIHFAPDDIELDLKELSVVENNQNLQLNAAVKVLLDQQNIDLSNIQLSTINSRLLADLRIGYDSFDTFINAPLSSSVSAKIQKLEVGPDDLSQLAFLLDEQPQLVVFLQHPISATGALQYTSNAFNANGLRVSWSDQTQFSIDGQVLNPLDTNLVSLDLSQFHFATKARDMQHIKTAFDLPIDLPNSITLDGSINASMKHLNGDLKFDSNEGKAGLSVAFNDSLSVPAYSAKTEFQNIDLGKWLQTNQLGKIDGTLTLSGKGLELDKMKSNAQLVINRAELLDQQLHSIDVGLSLDSGQYMLDIAVAEPSIKAELSGKGEFISAEHFTTDIHLSLEEFNLQTWKLAEDSIVVSSNVDLQLTRSADQNNLDLKVADSRFLTSTDQHLLKPIALNLTSLTDSMFFKLSSGLFIGAGHANASVDQLIKRSEGWVGDSISSDRIDLDSLFEGLIATTNIRFNPTSDEFEQIWPQVNVEDTIRLNMLINQPNSDYRLTASAPSTSYKRQQLINFDARLFSRRDTLIYEIGFEELKSGPAQIEGLSSNGWYIDQQWYNALQIDGSSDHPIIKVDTESRWASDTLYTHIVPESLTLDSLTWTLPEDNQVVYIDGGLLFYDFVLRHDNDLLEISSSIKDEVESLDMRFEDFQLRTLTSIINASEYPATGEINGFVDINGLQDHPSILADLEIIDLVVLEQEIGYLQWKSKSDEANGSIIDLSAQSDELDIKAAGTLGQTGMLDMELKLNKIAMPAIEGLSNGLIEKTTGYIAGGLSISGSDTLPSYKGSIDFHNVSFVVTDINAPFSLEDESITIDNDFISFENFSVRDEENNILELDGSIRTEDITDPTFDFHVVGKDFQLLNSTAKDNDLYYGKVAIDIDLAVKGRKSAPNVDVSARLNKGSNFTYVLPESQLEIEEREGVIMFFNQNDSSSLNEAVRVQPKIIDIEGIQLKAKLAIDPETHFKMIIDKRSGDYLEIGGEADLDINIDRKGKATMSGIYTARSGAYELRLYEIVQRKFEVVPGSRIIWSGDPYKAELDLTAQYNLRTSVKELMEEQVASADPTTQVSSRQDLPFEVLLRIQGSLEQPLMSFKLDMPEEVRNELGGNIYSRINQINENEDELNKQVFSLIAFNQFLPSAVTNATGSTTSNLAKSSVNQILSSQLNNLSQRYIKGIDVDFNLNSFSDYQTGSATDRTELSVSIKKALFDDRVVISVGNSVDIDGQSRQTNEWVDDVSVEYLLTEDGRYRLKGFQKNSFDDLVEGQVTITGLALLFSKEFNHFKNIFNSTEETK